MTAFVGLTGPLPRDPATGALQISLPSPVTTPTTLTPPNTSDGLKINVPAYADSTHSGLHLTDVGNRSAGPHLEVDQFGQGNGVDLHWFPANPVGTAGGCALGIHAYRDPGAGAAAFILDNTDAGASIKIRNTQGSNNPNGWGHGNFFELYGYVGASAHGTSDGTITSGAAILTSASGSFTAQDVGKPIRVPGAGAAAGNLDTTILSYQSATQVTLAANASTSVTTANYVYPQVGNVNQMAVITGGPPGFGAVSSTGSGNTGGIRFINKQPGLTNLSAPPWSFETDAGQCTAFQVVQPSGAFGALLVSHQGTGPFLTLGRAGGNNCMVIGQTGTDGATMQVGTTNGLKIGTATTQKLGFWNATPVVQQARPVTLADVIALGTLIGLWA